MTTHALDGLLLELDQATGQVVDVGDVNLEWVVPDAVTTFEYTYDVPNIGDTDIDTSAFYDLRLSDLIGNLLYDREALDLTEEAIFFLEWGPSNLTYLLDLEDTSLELNYTFVLGGDPLPVITTAAEANDFLDSITGEGEISSGPYAPDQPIPFASLLNVVSSEDDTVEGTSAGDIYDVGIGDDIVEASGGADDVELGDGVDVAFGQGGNDTIRGGLGDDNISGGAGADALIGGGSADSLFGDGGADDLFGNNAGDLLDGGAGNDFLNGGASNDELRGGTGDDDLLGSTGDDQLHGDAGADTFQFRANHGVDRIFDFEDGTDVIEFNINSVNDISDLTLTNVFAGVDIDYGTGTVRVLGLDDTDFSSADFVFI
jgi:Ca2+-binding RTX toxin-like protein